MTSSTYNSIGRTYIGQFSYHIYRPVMQPLQLSKCMVLGYCQIHSNELWHHLRIYLWTKHPIPICKNVLFNSQPDDEIQMMKFALKTLSSTRSRCMRRVACDPFSPSKCIFRFDDFHSGRQRGGPVHNSQVRINICFDKDVVILQEVNSFEDKPSMLIWWLKSCLTSHIC